MKRTKKTMKESSVGISMNKFDELREMINHAVEQYQAVLEENERLEQRVQDLELDCERYRETAQKILFKYNNLKKQQNVPKGKTYHIYE